VLRYPRRATGVLAGTLAAGLLLGGCGSEVRGSLRAPEDAVGTVLAERPCPDSEFRCITLAVPADHFAETSPLWEATFALHRGTVDSRGVLVTATGGPGSSGIASADYDMSTMPAEITDHYDVVFFDQRGVGLTRPFRCDDTMSETDAPTIDSTADVAARDAYAAASQEFVDACFTEARVPTSDAPRYATRQSAEDLEVFRRWLGADSMILYGESYGTQYQQTYAAAHPDHVAELLLDGPVDPGTDVRQFDLEAAGAYSDVLAATLSACDRDTVCAGDAPGTTKTAYDTLAAELAARPRGYAYPEPDGTREKRKLTLDDLESAASGSVSSPYTRTQFQRALNSAVLGDDVPMARLAETGNGTDPSFSEALYLAVECQDYDFVPPGGSGRSQLDAWLDAAEQAGVDDLRLGDVFYGDLPCLFWPQDGVPAVRPTIGTDPPYPVLLLTADTDPNTPTANADRLLGAIGGDVALVRQTGGPHVIYGRGEACVDDLVTRVITSGRLPSDRVTVCPGEVSEPYEPVAPARDSGYDDPDQTVSVLLAAVLDDPMVDAWSGDEPMTLGCSAGGTARYSLDWLNTMKVDLHGCAWTPGVPVDGSVTAEDGGYGDVELAVDLPFATLDLTKAGALTGTFRGRPVG
jgi:pimeloyl-ACP methyl ester carboxylesterase